MLHILWSSIDSDFMEFDTGDEESDLSSSQKVTQVQSLERSICETYTCEGKSRLTHRTVHLGPCSEPEEPGEVGTRNSLSSIPEKGLA